MPYAKGTIDFKHFKYSVCALRFMNRFEYGSNTYHLDQYSNLFLNAYMNCHVHAKYLKAIKFYSPFGIRHVFLYIINTNIYLNTSKSSYIIANSIFSIKHNCLASSFSCITFWCQLFRHISKFKNILFIY